MVLTAPGVVIHTSYVQSLLAELYEQDSAFYDKQHNGLGYASSSDPSSASHITPSESNSTTPIQPLLIPSIPESNDIYRDLLVACLRKNNGNRKLTALELGISTTTLWRKIRYYHLE